MDTYKKRKIWLAVLLSCLVPGLGQLYNGQSKKAISIYGVTIALGISLKIAFANFSTVAVWTCLIITLYLYVIIDAFYYAKTIKELALRPYNRWFIYLTIWILSVAINSYVRAIPYKAYKVPAGSMIPSLQIGDHFIIDTAYYRNHSLARGDIVVVLYPDDPTREFVKRVIGLPHDTVEILNKQVIINGHPLQESYIQHITEEIFPRTSSLRDNFGPIVVPSDSIFLLGDNRDSSLDSRFWKNTYAKIETIQGKALYIYWSKDLSRISKTFNL